MHRNYTRRLYSCQNIYIHWKDISSLNNQKKRVLWNLYWNSWKNIPTHRYRINLFFSKFQQNFNKTTNNKTKYLLHKLWMILQNYFCYMKLMLHLSNSTEKPSNFRESRTVQFAFHYPSKLSNVFPSISKGVTCIMGTLLFKPTQTKSQVAGSLLYLIEPRYFKSKLSLHSLSVVLIWQKVLYPICVQG